MMSFLFLFHGVTKLKFLYYYTTFDEYFNNGYIFIAFYVLKEFVHNMYVYISNDYMEYSCYKNLMQVFNWYTVKTIRDFFHNNQLERKE